MTDEAFCNSRAGLPHVLQGSICLEKPGHPAPEKHLRKESFDLMTWHSYQETFSRGSYFGDAQLLGVPGSQSGMTAGTVVPALHPEVKGSCGNCRQP